MSPAQCGPRLEHLSHRLRQLQARRDEITDIEEHQPHGPDREQITTLRERLDAALTHGETATVKSVLRELIATVDVHDGRLVQPRFRVPGAVRIRSRLDWQPQRGSNPCLHLERVPGGTPPTRDFLRSTCSEATLRLPVVTVSHPCVPVHRARDGHDGPWPTPVAVR